MKPSSGNFLLSCAAITAWTTQSMPKRWKNSARTASWDLVAVNGYYDVVSMTLNVAHVVPPKDAELPFKQAGR
jgi:hypothetical protein